MAASTLLLVLTLLRPDWIELVLRVDPDRGGGSLEWIVVAATASATAVFAARAQAELRRVRTAVACAGADGRLGR